MLLYTESMEVATPLAEVATPTKLVEATATAPTLPWSAKLKNRFVQPRLELGVSLGSDAFTVVSAGKSHRAPAKVAVKLAKGKPVLFGAEAEAIEGREPEGVKVVRPLLAGAVSDRRLAAKLLASTISSCRSRLKGAPRVAVAIPSGLSALESQTLVATVSSAGARSVHLIEQSMAAALGAGEDVLSAQGRLVVHAGAGVIDLAVISLAGTVMSRSIRIAGDAFNEAIRDHVRREHKLLIDERQAESIKRAIGSALPSNAVATVTVSGRDLVEGKPSQRELSSSEIDEVFAPLLAGLGQEVRAVVAAMPIALMGDLREQGALLTGGLAHLRGLDTFLSRETRLNFRCPSEPEQSVALGLKRLLREPALRQAVLGKRKAEKQTKAEPLTGGTGLLGGLVLLSGLALLTHSLPTVGQQMAGQLEQRLGVALTPSAPLLPTWSAAAADTGPSAEATFQGRQKAELEAENARLRKMLKAPLFKPSRDPIAADVVARDPNGWMTALSLNVGSQDGVKPGMAVTDGSNLVGLVDRVDLANCQVRLFTDDKAVVAARIRKSRGSGVAVGTGSDRMEMRYLDPDSGVRKGDWVVTSGLDKVYPPGLKLGWVAEVSQPSGQNSLTAVVQPAMNIHQLQQVLVLRR